MNWLQEPIMVFDTETSSLDPKTGAVIQLCMLRYESGKNWHEMDAWVNMCWPGDDMEIEAGATLAHGITKSMLAGKPMLTELMSGIIDLFNSCSAFMAFNSRFDIDFLQETYSRSGCRNSFPAIEHRTIDPMDFAFGLYPGSRGHKLEQMGPRLGITPRKSHDALRDCMSTAEVMTKMAIVHDLPEDLDALLTLQSQYRAERLRRWNRFHGRSKAR